MLLVKIRLFKFIIMKSFYAENRTLIIIINSRIYLNIVKLFQNLQIAITFGFQKEHNIENGNKTR